MNNTLAQMDIYRKNTPSIAHTYPYQMHLEHAPVQTSYSAKKKKKLSIHFWSFKILFLLKYSWYKILYVAGVLNTFSKAEIIANSNGIKLEVNNRRKGGMFTNMWIWNHIPFKKQHIKEEIIKEIGKYLRMNENKNTTC